MSTPAERNRPDRPDDAGRARTARLLGWLAPPMMMLGVVAGAAIVLKGPGAALGWVLAALFGAAMLWIVVSVLWPARADRLCPACGSEALERADAATTHGLACAGCGWRDEEASSFMLAEEEGPLEEIVLRERRARRNARRRQKRLAREQRRGKSTLSP